MKIHEEYDWSILIDDNARQNMVRDIDQLIAQGNYWKNSPPYQTDVNVFGLQSPEWNNLKMSFIWSCFAFSKKKDKLKLLKVGDIKLILLHKKTETCIGISIYVKLIL